MARGRDSQGRFVSSAGEGGVRIPSGAEYTRVQKRKPHPLKWSEAGRAEFIRVLGETWNVAAACRAAKVNYVTAYRHRKADASFRQAWRQAIAQSYARLEVELLERALIAETRIRSALATAGGDDAAALEVLTRYPTRLAELLYRTHRQEALEEDAATDQPIDEEESIAALRERVDALRRQVLAEQGAS